MADAEVAMHASYLTALPHFAKRTPLERESTWVVTSRLLAVRRGRRRLHVAVVRLEKYFWRTVGGEGEGQRCENSRLPYTKKQKQKLGLYAVVERGTSDYWGG